MDTMANTTTTIRIADEPHPRTLYNEETTIARTTSTRAQDDGIYNIRSRSLGNPKPQLSRAMSMRSQDGDPGLLRDDDLRKAQVFKGKMLFWLAYQSIGVIYGDISTSPLYVYSSTFTSPPNREDLIGVLSIIIWALILMVTVKYILIILHADNDGEGGTFSTYAMLSRYINITNRDPREASLVRMKRQRSMDLESGARAMRRGMESSKLVRNLLKVIGIFAVTMVMSDGVLTPAQSVLGAVQGIEVVDPNISKGTIIGVTDAILVLLFAIQPFGISNITILFSPIIIIWLGFNAAFGIYNLANYDAGVFKAFNPGYAFLYLIHHKEQGWRSLGGILLAFTGVEALFADLGAFSRRAIQLSWLCYTFPCLLLAYIGQAAYIAVHPEAYSNPFFNCAPPGTIYPALVIAILAAIVASQAIITASFQLLAQVMKLSYFPQLKVVHTSKVFHGQLYVPLANWLLMVGTILIASIYNNTTSLGNAYGVCVMFVTFFDTCMVSLVAIFVWGFSPFLVILPWLTIASMDGAFLSSALTKVPDGAWFTILLSAVLASIFLVWRYGKEQQWFAEAEDRYPTSHFVTKDKTTGELSLTPRFDSISMSTIKGFGVFFDKAGETTPTVFSQFALKLTAAPEIMVFFHLRPLEHPSVSLADRHTVSRLAIPNCYRLVLRYGYNDEVVSPDLGAVVYEQIRNFLIAESAHEQSKITLDNDEKTASSDDEEISDSKAGLKETNTNPSLGMELARLDAAFHHKNLYIIGKESMKIKPKTNIVRKTLLSAFLWMRENSRNKMANLKVPADSLIEVGFLKEI